MSVQTKHEIFSILLKNQNAIKALGVKRIGLFGSFVRNEQRAESDIDLLAEFERGLKNFDNFMNLSFLLEDLLGRKTEVLTPESVSPYILPYIAGEAEYVPFTV